MATNIPLFPTISDEMLGKISYKATSYEFYYTDNDKEFLLRSEEIEKNIMMHKIIDDNGIWSIDDFNFCIKRSYSLSKCSCLFGENGIACKDAVLGIALVWTSSDSKQRGVIPIGDIENSQKDIDLILKYEFSKAQLRGLIEFTTVIYIKNTGKPSLEEEHLANTYGYVLGELDKFIIKLDGEGSVFPIYEVSDPLQPLWYVKCEWDDPTYEKFSDCVSININRAHKNYKFLDKTKKTFNEQLLKEVMSSAIILIITKLKEERIYWDATINGYDLNSGSVSAAIYYFINTLEWDVSKPENMSMSIRNFFDQRM